MLHKPLFPCVRSRGCDGCLVVWMCCSEAGGCGRVGMHVLSLQDVVEIALVGVCMTLFICHSYISFPYLLLREVSSLCLLIHIEFLS